MTASRGLKAASGNRLGRGSSRYHFERASPPRRSYAGASTWADRRRLYAPATFGDRIVNSSTAT